jgi:hypothetical protein
MLCRRDGRDACRLVDCRRDDVSRPGVWRGGRCGHANHLGLDASALGRTRLTLRLLIPCRCARLLVMDDARSARGEDLCRKPICEGVEQHRPIFSLESVTVDTDDLIVLVHLGDGEICSDFHDSLNECCSDMTLLPVGGGPIR